MTYRAQITIPMYTGIPEDVVTNTLYFQRLDAGPATDVDLENMIDHLTTFYAEVYGNSTPLGAGSIASYMRPGSTSLKVYDLDDPKPRVAVREQGMPFGPVQDPTSSLPQEVALCLSFRTEPTPGVAVGSQRGRIYLGGLGNGFLDVAGTSTYPRIKIAAFNDVTNAALKMFNSMLADEWGWVIHSEKLDQDFAVAEIWVDNSFDTQRRRGNKATLRATVTTPEGP